MMDAKERKRMRIVILSLASTLLFASHCWKIKNADQRALCEAKFEHRKSCWKIKNSDVRAYCEATAQGKRSCWKIRENDLKAMCEAELVSK